MPKDYYAILDVDRNATQEQIRARFRTLARDRHPDRFQGTERTLAEGQFQAITEAFNVLSSPERRRGHDIELSRTDSQAQPTDGNRLARVHLQAGVKSYREGNQIAAAESFDRATKADPENAQAWHHLAQACSHHAKYRDQALAAIVRACELKPMNSTYLKLAARLHAEAGLVDRAEQYYNEALTWGGEDPAVRLALEDLRKSAKKRRPGLFGKVG